jgi:mono/diheme cytochrome c family protein
MAAIMIIRSTRSCDRGGAPRAVAVVLRCVGLAWVGLAAACSDGRDTTFVPGIDALDPAALEPSAEVTPQQSPDAPTFGEHVSPIFNAKCVGCHQEGGIGPFRLDDYETAKSWGNLIVAATSAHVMPPFLMETGGECGSFDESGALSDEQIATIAEWVRAGAAEGPAARIERPALPTLPAARAWTTPRFAPLIQGGPLATFDEYRCFRVPLGLERDTWATGAEVLPGNSQIVHHVVGFLVDPNAPALEGTNAEMMDRFERDDPERDGWPCFATAGEGISIESVPVQWGPGTGAFSFPRGAGIRVQRDRELVVQVHYNLASAGAAGQTDQTTVKLRLVDQVERQALFVLPDPMLDTLATDEPAALPPGQKSVSYTWARSVEEMLGGPIAVPLELISLGAHMHERGRKWTYELDNGSGFECIGRVNRWDFNWQRKYDYAVAPVLTGSSQLRLTCEYDTSADTEPVLPGWGTRNEMCLSVMMLAFPPGVSP